MKGFKKLLVMFLLCLPICAFSLSDLGEPSSTSQPGGEDYLPVAEVMPSPIGGMDAIRKMISYPDFARKAGLQGNVYVLAFISETGAVDNVKLVKGIGGGCDDQVIDAVQKTKFTPGTNKGVPVKVKLSLAFSFKI